MHSSSNRVALSWFNKAEPWLFMLLLCSVALPVLLVRYYPTLDGPAHLYMANAGLGLLKSGDTIAHSLFEFNSMPVPNTLGHVILGLGLRVFPAWLAEKLFLLIYLLLTPIFFRRFIHARYGKGNPVSLLIFPFLHNHILYFGFFNFLLGICILFGVLMLYAKILERRRHRAASFLVSESIMLGFIFLLLWFSHIMPLMIAFLFIGLMELEDFFMNNSKKFTSLLHMTFVLSLIALPVMILSLLYFIRIDSVEPGKRLPSEKLFFWLFNVRPVLGLKETPDWTFWGKIILACILLLIAGALAFHFQNRSQTKRKNKALPMLRLLPAIIFLLLYFILPDSILLTDRLILIFYLALLPGLAQFRFAGFSIVCFVPLLLFAQSGLILKYTKSMTVLSKDAGIMDEFAHTMKPNSLVLTFNYSDNWLHSHITNYIGAAAPLGVLESYEAGLKWFPVNWSEKQFALAPLKLWGANNRHLACGYFCSDRDTDCFILPGKQNYSIPYIVTIGHAVNNEAGCETRISTIIESQYHLTEDRGFFRLYERNSH